MKSTDRTAHGPVALALVLASCAAAPSDPSAPLAVETMAAVGSPVGAAAPAAPSGVQWGDLDLAVWRDPRFQKRFTESYLAETDVEPRVTEQERQQLQQILELITAERVDRAVELLQKRGGEGTSAVFDFTLGNIYFQQEELYQARDAYQSAVEKYPKFRRAWKNLGLVHVRRTDFREAAKALARVVELGGGDGITYGLLAFAYSNLEQHMSAESAYRMAILLDPETPDWTTGLARCFFKQKRFAEAVTLCGNLVEEDPDRADLWLLQANAYIGLGQPLRAAENFEIVDRLGASTFDSLTTLGDIYVNEGVFDVAVRSYLRALEIDPEGNPQRALGAAKVLTVRGAQEECATLIAGLQATAGERLADAERIALLKIQARMAAAKEASEEEARILEEIVALDPVDGEALILLGQHYGRTGETEKAVFYFERAAGIESSEADASVRHAQLLVSQLRFAEAVPLLRRAQDLRPRDSIQRYLEQVERAAQSR